MTDIALFPVGDGDEYDAQLLAGDLVADESLDAAILVSLLSDAEYPDAEDGDRRGWWGDALNADPSDRWGSLLWTHARDKQTDATLQAIAGDAKAALQWMLTDGVASAVDVAASWADIGYCMLEIDLAGPTGPRKIRLAYLWQQTVGRSSSGVGIGALLVTLIPGTTTFSARLSWTPTPNAAQYAVYMVTVPGTEQLYPTTTVSGTGTGATVTGLSANTRYYFRVAALDADGNLIAISAEIAATTGNLPPQAPTGLVAASGDGQVGLSWTAGAGDVTYNVYEGTASGGESAMPALSGIAGTSASVTGLLNGTAYFFIVKAVGGLGDISTASNEASATPSVSAYFGRLLTDGATGLWPLDETSGTVARNLVDSAAPGTYLNSPTLSQPKLLNIGSGSALFTSGTLGGKVQLPASALVGNQASGTVSLAGKFADDGVIRVFLSNVRSSDSSTRWQITQNDGVDGLLKWDTYTGSGTDSLQALVPNGDHLVECTWTPSGKQIYIDGGLVSSNTTAGQSAATVDTAYGGANAGSSFATNESAIAVFVSAMSGSAISAEAALAGLPAASGWSPSDKATDIQLAGNGLIAVNTVGGSWESVRSLVSHSSGKWMFGARVMATTAGHVIVGFGTAAANINSYAGSDAYSWGQQTTGGGNVYHSGSLTSTSGPGYPAICVVDVDAGKMWLGSWSTSGAGSYVWAGGGDPIAGTSPTYTFPPGTELYAMASCFDQGSQAYLWQNAGDFPHGLLSGFSAWGNVSNAAAAFSPYYKPAQIALSGGNATATMSSGSSYCSAFSTQAPASTKVYAEFSLDSLGANGVMFGVYDDAALPLGGLASYVGSDPHGFSINNANAYFYSYTGGGYHLSGLSGVGAGHRLCVAYSRNPAGSDCLWFGIDGVWPTGGDPATGANPTISFTGGTTNFRLGASFMDTGAAGTIYGDSASLAHAPPAGFGPWSGF